MHQNVSPLFFVLAASLALGCSTDPGGGGGTAGEGGVSGGGGAGGTVANCTLTGEWETVGAWGSDASTYGNVVVLQSPVDDSLWQAVSRTHVAEPDALDIALLRSANGGDSWDEVSVWPFPAERRGWHSDAAIADDGTIFVVLREYTLFEGAVSDRLVKLLRYAPGGDLVEAGSFNPDGSTDTRSNTIVTRGNEAWFIAFNASAAPPDYHIVKYENGALQSIDVIRYGAEANEVYVRDLAVAPNGEIWTAGQGYDGDPGIWHATLWQEDDTDFSLLADLQMNVGIQESDTIMALTFDADERFWASYYTIHDGKYRWRAGHGAADAPESSFVLNDEFSLDETKASLSNRIAVHPSGTVFMGGYAIDSDGWQWGIVREGTTEGFEPSDKFIHQNSGDFRTDVSSLFVDEQGNVWLAYMSRHATSWSGKRTTLKKMHCVR